MDQRRGVQPEPVGPLPGGRLNLAQVGGGNLRPQRFSLGRPRATPVSRRSPQSLAPPNPAQRIFIAFGRASSLLKNSLAPRTPTSTRRLTALSFQKVQKFTQPQWFACPVLKGQDRGHIIPGTTLDNIYDSQTDGFLQSSSDPFSDLAIDTLDPCFPLVNSWCSIASALASWALRYCFLRRPRSSGIVANPARPASNIVFGSGTAPTEDSGVPWPQWPKRMFRSS